MKNITVKLFAIFGLFISLHAQSSVIYSSPDWEKPGTQGNAWCATCGGSWFVSDEFTLNSGATIGGTNLEVANWYGSNWNVNLSIWDVSLTTKLFDTVVSSYATMASSTPSSVVLNMLFDGPTLAAGSYRMQWFDQSNMAIYTYSGNSNTSLQGSTRTSINSTGGMPAEGIRFQVLATSVEVSR